MLWTALVAATFAQDGAWPELPVPAAGSGGDGSKDAAVVIAIEDYFRAPDLPGARENGMAWVDWLGTARKIPVVKPIFDENATREQILADVAAVSREVRSGGRMWVIFIGHGAPSKDGKDGLLEGADVQQNAISIEARGVRRSELVGAIEDNVPNNSNGVLLLDACFSGQTASGDLAAGLAPLRDVSFAPSSRVSVLTAAANNQYAGPLSDSSRPAFSYLVLGALRGWGDDGDGKVYASEAVAYAQRALLTTVVGRQQTPSYSGPDLALSPAAKREGPKLSRLAAGVGTYARSKPSESASSSARSSGPEPAVPAAPAESPAIKDESPRFSERYAGVSEPATEVAVGHLQGKQHVEGGFEVGLPLALRLGWHQDGAVVSSWGARCLIDGGYNGRGLLGPSGYVDFRLSESWDFEASLGAGVDVGRESMGPMGYAGAALQYDPDSFFQLNLGVIGGYGIIAARNFIGPDITAGFVW